MRIAATGAFLAIATTAVAATEHRVAEWPRMSLALAGENVVYAVSTTARIRPGGYVIHRTDSFTLPVRGEALAGTRRAGIVVRTSAGGTTAGPLVGGPAGRHVLVATGRGFSPQVIFCCRPPENRDFPVEASGRVDAPVTVAAAVEWPLVRIVTVSPAGTTHLITRTMGEAPGLPFGNRLVTPLDAQPLTGLVAMSAGRVAWVDTRAPGEVRVAAIAAGGSSAGPATAVPQSGQVVRLHMSDQTLVTVLRTADAYEVVRHDLPDLRPTVVWTGTRPPGPTAAGASTIAIVDGTRVVLPQPGGTSITALRLRGKGAAVAVDGRRVAVIERIRVQGRAGPVKRSAIRIAPISSDGVAP